MFAPLVYLALAGMLGSFVLWWPGHAQAGSLGGVGGGRVGRATLIPIKEQFTIVSVWLSVAL